MSPMRPDDEISVAATLEILALRRIHFKPRYGPIFFLDSCFINSVLVCGPGEWRGGAL